MKIRIKLANGIEINKEFTAEQLQKAEQSKFYRQANRNGKRFYYGCHLGLGGGSGYYNYNCDNCRYKSQCKDNREKRVNVLNSYINYLQTI